MPVRAGEGSRPGAVQAHGAGTRMNDEPAGPQPGHAARGREHVRLAARMTGFVPAVSRVPGYKPAWFSRDAVAGFTIWGPAFNLDHHGVVTVGKVAAGLPSDHTARLSVSEMRRFYALVPREFWLGMVTLLGVVTLDVLPGLIIGVVTSILLLVYRASRPRFSVMGADPDVPGAYEDIRRHPGARPIPGMLIVRPDAPLFYANSQSLRDTVTEMIRSSNGTIRTVILDLDANDELDITSTEALAKVIAELADHHVLVALAHVHATTADMIRRSATEGKPGADQIFPNLDSAVEWAGRAPSRRNDG